MNIKCPHCKGVYHQTTDKYDPERAATGSMLELLPKYKKMGWSDYHTFASESSLILCPYCEGQLAPKGKLLIHIDELACKYCRKTFKNIGGRMGHERTCKARGEI